MGAPRILPADHPLAGVYNVGPEASRALRANAAEVLGVAIGEVVRCRFREGRRAVVVRLNPADLEVAIELRGSGGRMLWCRRDEVDAAASHSNGRPIGEKVAA